MSVCNASARGIIALVLLAVLVLPWLDTVGAQQSPRAADHLQPLAEAGKALKKMLPPEARSLLSAGGHQLITLAERSEVVRQARSDRRGRPPEGQSLPQLAGGEGLARGLANDPFAPEDFISRLAGMTQSGPSVAWCDSNAVIGFNDSGSLIGTQLGHIRSTSASFNGWSLSTDAGRTFTDMGALVPDPLPPGIRSRDLFGDPVVHCSGPSTFYYASLAVDTTPSDAEFSGISVSRSTDGGRSWGGAVIAARKRAPPAHFLDRPSMAVVPGRTPDHDVIHVSYTDFDATERSPACPGTLRMAIEYVRSVDGGRTWSAPLVIDQVCGRHEAVQASQVVALGRSTPGPQTSAEEVAAGARQRGSDVYVAWERFAPTREIRIRTSIDGGLSFKPRVVVAPVTSVGAVVGVHPDFEETHLQVLQGLFRTQWEFHGLAVDRSPGPHWGTLYITWHDGRHLTRPEPLSFPSCTGEDAYCFGDILLSRSTDRGATWSRPVRVNDDPIGLAVDQFLPAVDVDKQGAVVVAFYDRREDARNFLIDTYLAESSDGGRSWSNHRVTRTSFAPITAWQDQLVGDYYMGDRIGIAADATQANQGVIMAWGDNSLGDTNVLFGKRE